VHVDFKEKKIIDVLIRHFIITLQAWIVGVIRLASAHIEDCVVGISTTEHVSSDILLEPVTCV
jgi:hypothetical protein